MQLHVSLYLYHLTNSFIVQLNSPSFACRNLKHGEGEKLVHDHYIKVV